MSQKNPMLRIVWLTLAILALLTTVASAATGSINATDVRFREQPTTGSGILDLLDKETPIEVIERQGDWYKVNHAGVEGFVYSRFVTVEDPVEEADAKKPGTALVTGETVYINANSLNLRKEPSAESEKIGEVTRSKSILYIEPAGEYARILTTDGIFGYVLAKYLVDDPKLVSRSSDSRVDQLIKIANSMQGVPYVYGGNTTKGIDCSGFVKYVYGKIGITTPRSAVQFGSYGVKVDRANLRVGDIVLFDTDGPRVVNISHVGIYLGNDRFIHASTTNRRVIVASFSGYPAPYLGARRVLR